EATRRDRVVAPRRAELVQAVVAVAPGTVAAGAGALAVALGRSAPRLAVVAAGVPALRRPAVFVAGESSILPRPFVALVVRPMASHRFILRPPARLVLVWDGDVAPAILRLIGHGSSWCSAESVHRACPRPPRGALRSLRAPAACAAADAGRSEEHKSELQSRQYL